MIQIDMPMPDNCDECRFNTEYGFCKAMPDNFCGNTDNRERPKWCPLKEQEAVKPKSKVRHGANAQIQHFCGNCMTMLHGKPKYCSNCGRPVLWEGR